MEGQRQDETTDTGQKTSMLGRALILLETIAGHADGIGVREAARQTGIDRSAVSRILTQFEEFGYAEQDGTRGVFVAGPGLFALVAALSERDSLWKAAEPFLKDLVARFNETCYVAVRVGDDLVFRGKVDCEHRIRYVIEMGKPFPLVSGAAGTAILSALDERESEALLSGELPAYTPASITDRDEYRAQLRADRELGYTFSPGRWVRGGAGIAAPYYDASGRVAGAIALSCLADRLDSLRVHEAGKAVAEACRGLSRRLGHIEAPSHR